eukprot:TRINITY_DN101945_c0_g1_i1.p1 TRINITY_DN101945_c0_g1~~TRINITY_DN101945_c0_g1_i1.p1  ORF type:complete len:311 (+),score=53.89 TRINITY_DN101945_c0_g1_i1:39-935(+)
MAMPPKSLIGQIYAWNVEKGYGFVRPIDGGKELFVHVNGLVNGDGSVKDDDFVTYEFCPKQDANAGRDMAIRVKVANDWDLGISEAPRMVPLSEGTRHGVILNWNSKKGTGFIKPDMDGKGMKNIYVDVSALVPGYADTVKAGDRVTFDTTIDEIKGKPTSMNVQKEQGAPPPPPPVRGDAPWAPADRAPGGRLFPPPSSKAAGKGKYGKDYKDPEFKGGAKGGGRPGEWTMMNGVYLPVQPIGKERSRSRSRSRSRRRRSDSRKGRRRSPSYKRRGESRKRSRSPARRARRSPSYGR